MIPIDTLLSNEQIIRVFPVRTEWTPKDAMAFVGFPPLPEFQPGTRKTPVHVSVTFPQHRNYAEKLRAAWSDYYDEVKIGGPAYGDPGGEFIPGRYLKKGCTITMRGCTKRCGYCGVPAQEGKVRLLQIKPGWIVQDNNLLACPHHHIEAVFEMLRQQKRAVFFNGGLDKDYFNGWHRELLDSILIGELWFACDESWQIPRLERVSKLLEGIPLRKKRCYTLIGWQEGETLNDAEKRLERVFELDFLPFCQLYQPPDQPKFYDHSWKALARKWSRPAAIFASHQVLA